MAEIKQLAGPQSRRRFLAVGGGSTALAAFLAACGSDSGTTTDQHDLDGLAAARAKPPSSARATSASSTTP